MESKHISRKHAGRPVGAEGRLAGLVGGSILIITSPIYLTHRAVAKAREYFSDSYVDTGHSLSYFCDTLKLCWSAFTKGRLPERAD